MSNAVPLYWQETLHLSAKKRGFHLITADISSLIESMPKIQAGLLHLFLQHTSASLCISENTCNDVRTDHERFFNHLVPEDNNFFTHTLEGSDDMPAHIKNVMLGANLTLPLQDGKLGLGTWQGIFLCEHRNQATARNIILTAHGLPMKA